MRPRRSYRPLIEVRPLIVSVQAVRLPTICAALPSSRERDSHPRPSNHEPAIGQIVPTDRTICLPNRIASETCGLRRTDTQGSAPRGHDRSGSIGQQAPSTPLAGRVPGPQNPTKTSSFAGLSSHAPAGSRTWIYRLGGGRLIHWTTRASPIALAMAPREGYRRSATGLSAVSPARRRRGSPISRWVIHSPIVCAPIPL